MDFKSFQYFYGGRRREPTKQICVAKCVIDLLVFGKDIAGGTGVILSVSGTCIKTGELEPTLLI